MAPAFSKEAILQGSIDHLCLVCESYLRSERDVCQHVSTPEHRQNLDTTDYVDKYRNDRIRKVKKWYYCEFCNVLVSTITKVRLHVEELRHKENVAAQMISRMDNDILSGNITISEESWHGFIDENTCTICNIEFDNKDDHKNESSHIINLIQSKIIIDFCNCYRKIDDSTFHCLTCNMVVAGITAHLDDTKHKNLIQKCIKVNPLVMESCNVENTMTKSLINSINEDYVVEDEKNVNTNDHSGIIKILEIPTENKGDVNIDEHVTTDQKTNVPKGNNKHTSDILDYIEKFQKEHININLESCTAVCKRCSENLEFDSKVINNHIEEKHILNNIQRETKSSLPAVFKNDENKASNSGTLLTSPVFQNKNLGKEETKQTEKIKQKHAIIQKIAEEYDLTYSDNNIYCEKCNKQIPLAVKNIKQHVNGELHKNNVAKVTNKATHLKENENKKITVKRHNFQKVPIIQFVRNLTSIKNVFAEDVVINEKYCINFLALAFLTMISPGRLRCLVCEENVNLQNMKEHLDLTRHDRAMNEVPVLIHPDSEFIREIRSDTFQCGFCNIVDSWEGMENHLKSTSHKESKNFANWRLTEHLPLIRRHNMQRRIENEFLMRLWM